MGEYLVHATLDCWISRNTILLAYSGSTCECTKWDATVTGRVELCENMNPLQGLTFDGKHGETKSYVLEAELKMDASQTVK